MSTVILNHCGKYTPYLKHHARKLLLQCVEKQQLQSFN